MKNLLILVVLIVIIVITALGWVRSSGETKRVETNLYNSTYQWEDERGRLVTETTELRFTNRELKKVSKMDSVALSEAEMKVFKANQVIKDLNMKSKRVDAVHMLELKASSNHVTEVTIQDLIPTQKSKIKIAPIKTKHLELTFNHVGDSIHVSHLYKTDVDIAVDRDKGLNSKGKKRFFVLRWIHPKWEYSSSAVAEDPDAEITSNVYINFQRKKGKRK